MSDIIILSNDYLEVFDVHDRLGMSEGKSPRHAQHIGK